METPRGLLHITKKSFSIDWVFQCSHSINQGDRLGYSVTVQHRVLKSNIDLGAALNFPVGLSKGRKLSRIFWVSSRLITWQIRLTPFSIVSFSNNCQQVSGNVLGVRG